MLDAQFKKILAFMPTKELGLYDIGGAEEPIQNYIEDAEMAATIRKASWIVDNSSAGTKPHVKKDMRRPHETPDVPPRGAIVMKDSFCYFEPSPDKKYTANEIVDVVHQTLNTFQYIIDMVVPGGYILIQDNWPIIDAFIGAMHSQLLIEHLYCELDCQGGWEDCDLPMHECKCKGKFNPMAMVLLRRRIGGDA